MEKKLPFKIKDAKKFKRFVVIIGILLFLAISEVTFIKMKIENAALPKQIAELEEKRDAIISENNQLKESVFDLGNYDNKKGLEDSWARLKAKLETAVEATSS